jgi:hypothetical protein
MLAGLVNAATQGVPGFRLDETITVRLVICVRNPDTLFKMLSDRLAGRSSAILALRKPAVSKHLAVLKGAGPVSDGRVDARPATAPNCKGWRH